MEKVLRPSVVSEASFGSPVSRVVPDENLAIGVSWAAVMAGAFVIAALSLILVALGSGLGLAAVSPWPNAGTSAVTLGGAAIVWLMLLQLIPSAMGGYLAGRLRSRWTRIHNDEVFFRDTAHGFLAWALAVVVTAAFLATAAATVLGVAARSGSAREESALSNRNEYAVDTLFRAESPNVPPVDASVRAEALRTVVNATMNPNAPSADWAYLAKLVAARTGIPEAEAQQRVSNVIAQSRQEMDSVRKAAATVSLWTFVGLLMGAFAASYAATVGGRQRDQVAAV